MNQKSNKKGAGVIIALAVAILLGVIVLVVAIGSLSGAGGLKQNEPSKYITTEPRNTETTDDGFNLDDYTEDDTVVGDSGAGNTQAAIGNGNNSAGDSVQTNPVTPNTYEDPVEHYENIEKNGENILSDHHDNKYIKLVASNYKVDTDKLVAIYSSPDTGNNLVLEFSGKKDGNGNVVKSPDTLVRVYKVDKNKNITVATGKTTGNVGISYEEAVFSFNMVKVLIMPQYPDYFDGV